MIVYNVLADDAESLDNWFATLKEAKRFYREARGYQLIRQTISPHLAGRALAVALLNQQQFASQHEVLLERISG